MSTMPDFSGFLPTVLLFISIAVSVIFFLVHEFIILPPVARRMRKAKWTQCSPGFVQDDAGRVHFVINDIELPEGVVHNKRGWFLKPRPPFIKRKEEAEEEKPKRGRKKKTDQLTPEQEAALGTILEVPVLEGLGKGVFFGYDGSPLVANLKTLVHADLRIMKEIIPATISRTQLGNLHRWSVNKGYEKRGGDTQKFLILMGGMICLVVVVGIIAYMILNAGGGVA
jgi:hypothetical protein